ncbi:MAG TPA: TetR family transcriptional regulator [Myxococcota bacterium]|jgi:DNA-binding transcriptional regulator YbjK|nr:TetR family transcriptional regulator [Myxococcota bacterium]
MTRHAALPAPSLPQAELRRRGILSAALRVIAEGGIDAVTHRRVAAEADVPLGSTTYYFESRDELVRAAFGQYATEVFALVAAIAREKPLRKRDDVVEFLVEVARREFSDPRLLRLEYELILQASRDPLLAREFDAYEHGLASRLAEALEALAAPQAFEAARTLIALVRGFELEGLVRPGLDVDLLRRRLRAVIAALAPADSGARRRTERSPRVRRAAARRRKP